MKTNLLLCVFFAALILFIPLLALRFELTEPYQGNSASSPTGTKSSSSLNPSSISSSEELISSSTAASAQPAQEILEEEISTDALQEAAAVKSFQILNLSTGKVESVALEDYVLGSVCAEMPPSFEEEALKAQAVASRTYALRARADSQKHPSQELKGADFSADPLNWKGYVTEKQFLDRYGDKGEVYLSAIREAIRQVEGEILIYRNTPIVAAYHSMSAGYTEDASNVWSGQAPYLVPVESPGDLLAPKYETSERFSPEDLQTLLKAKYPSLELPKSPSDWFTNLIRSNSGYLLSLTAGNTEIEGKELRSLLGLRSTNLEIQYLDGSFLFKVSGYGHGVGLSQYGADYLARQGETYDQILHHYYTDVELVTLADYR